MDKIRCVLVDDEVHAIKALTLQIEKYCPELDILNSFTDPEEAVVFLKDNSIDLLFLDIEMPRLNGFQLLEKWSQVPFKVVFTTAYDEFAVEAFRITAFDYLLKPIDRTLLKETVNRFKVEKEASNTSWDQLNILQQLINRQASINVKVPLPVSDGLRFVQLCDIIRCQGDGGYTFVYLIKEKPILLSKTLKEVEETLFAKSDFIRVHQSHLINPSYLKQYIKKDGGYLLLDDDSQIPLSRRKKDNFFDSIR